MITVGLPAPSHPPFLKRWGTKRDCPQRAGYLDATVDAPKDRLVVPADDGQWRRQWLQQRDDRALASYFGVHKPTSPDCSMFAKVLNEDLFRDTRGVTKICDKFMMGGSSKVPAKQVHRESCTSSSTAQSEQTLADKSSKFKSPQFDTILQDAYRRYTQNYYSQTHITSCHLRDPRNAQCPQVSMDLSASPPSLAKLADRFEPKEEVSAFRLSIEAIDPNFATVQSAPHTNLAPSIQELSGLPSPPTSASAYHLIHGFESLQVIDDFKVRVRRVKLN
jgi:hypothetical protein